jgi:hypothetical protein
LEYIGTISKDEGGNVLKIFTDNYEFNFPTEKRPNKDVCIQKGDVFQFNCQAQGGTSLYPRATIVKPGLERPIYSEIVPVGCIQPTVH